MMDGGGSEDGFVRGDPHGDHGHMGNYHDDVVADEDDDCYC